VLQNETSHAGLAAIHQILMNRLEAFLSIVIICIDHNERSINHIFRCKDGLASPPRLSPAFRQSPRAVVDILESVVHSYTIRSANRGNAFSDDFFELLLDILSDDKYHKIEASLDCIMNRVIHDNMVRSIYRLQLLDSCSK